MFYERFVKRFQTIKIIINMELIFKGYTGILGDVFQDIIVNIVDDKFIISNNEGISKVFNIAPKQTDYVYKFTKKEIRLCESKGLKHFIEAQDKDNIFHISTRSMLESKLLK